VEKADEGGVVVVVREGGVLQKKPNTRIKYDTCFVSSVVCCASQLSLSVCEKIRYNEHNKKAVSERHASRLCARGLQNFALCQAIASFSRTCDKIIFINSVTSHPLDEMAHRRTRAGHGMHSSSS
jgi:hypothetical protein